MARPSATKKPAPEKSSAPSRRHSARRRIDDEHRQLGELLLSLVHTHDLHRVAKLLADLDALLVHHFDGEEGGQGLHSIVSEGASHRLPNLQHLFDEHREILAKLAELRSATAAALAGPVEEIAAGIHALAETLRRHEAEEERLFGEAFYTDLGGRSS
jgi:hemerythrin